jgi:bifunctional non-homologous end joining protein LigD
MLLTEAKRVWSDPNWICEAKHDGYRLLVHVANQKVLLRTRNSHDATGWFPELTRPLSGLTPALTVLDGEVCVLDELGRPDFDLIHRRAQRRRWYPGADAVVFVAFDMLALDGQDLRMEPLELRKLLLTEVFGSPPERCLLMQHFPSEQASALFAAAVQLKLEGVVLKQLGTPYVSGEPRSGSWVKVKRPGAIPAQRFSRRT